MNRFVTGIAAGTAATGNMSLFMEAARAVGQLDREPPEIITANLEAKSGAAVAPELSFDQRWKLAHVAFGAGAGVAFGLMRGALPRSTIAAGLLFGAGVWAAMYGGALPAAGLYPEPEDDWTPRARTIALAHLVYGVTLAAAFDRASPSRR